MFNVMLEETMYALYPSHVVEDTKYRTVYNGMGHGNGWLKLAKRTNRESIILLPVVFITVRSVGHTPTKLPDGSYNVVFDCEETYDRTFFCLN